MTDLTDKWKKGELLDGHYYVKDGENMIAEYLDGYFYNNGEPMSSFSGGVDEVLAPVPSYEEYKDLKSKLQLKETAYDFDTARLEEENTKLKEQINKFILDSINRGTANAVKAVKEFGMPERIEELAKQNTKVKTDCRTLAQKLLQVKPELREWLEVNYKEYL